MKDKIIVNNVTVDQLKPIRRNFKNKNKNYSATGYYGDIKVKVYEIFDPNQGTLREFISNHNKLSPYFPKLFSFNSRYIVEEWINGKILKNVINNDKEEKKKSYEIKKFLNLMWSVKYDKQAFDYINYIHNRVNKKNNFDLSNVPIRINHNDLSLENIIQTNEGLKIIDNEFLGCSTGWIMNIKNSFLKENFQYQNFVSIETLNSLWNVRKEWSGINIGKSKYTKKLFYNLIKKIL